MMDSIPGWERLLERSKCAAVGPCSYSNRFHCHVAVICKQIVTYPKY